MRIKISFANKVSPTYLPINTNYHIVKLINGLTYDYQKYLKALMRDNHSCENFSIYTFSQLIIPERKIDKFNIGIVSEEFYLYISSPFYQFLSILSKELRKRRNVKIHKSWFGIVDVDFFTCPSFNESEAQFTCLSPVTVYRDEQEVGNNIQYIFPDEKEYYKYIEKDLLRKYNLINNENRNHIDMQVKFDSEYIKRKQNKITKVIRLEDQVIAPKRVRGVLAPLKIKADPDILKLIYDAGLGRLNNYGFGMVETVRPTRVA